MANAANIQTRYVTSKDGKRTVLVPATDALHALAWGRLAQGSKPKHVSGPVRTLTEAQAIVWLTRERTFGDFVPAHRRSAQGRAA